MCAVNPNQQFNQGVYQKAYDGTQPAARKLLENNTGYKAYVAAQAPSSPSVTPSLLIPPPAPAATPEDQAIQANQRNVGYIKKPAGTALSISQYLNSGGGGSGVNSVN